MNRKDNLPMFRRWREILRGISAFAAGRQLTRRCIKDEDGSTLVEMAVSAAVVLMLIFGVFDFSLAFYTYHYVSDAAREGSRWAMVRGSRSCTQTPNLEVCKAGDTTGATAADISAYVAGCGAKTSTGATVCGSSGGLTGLGYPGIDATDYMTVNTTWLNAGTVSGTGGETWSTCGSSGGCNAPGDQVQVQVTYAFPITIPFWWKNQSLSVSSTSSMVIAQ